MRMPTLRSQAVLMVSMAAWVFSSPAIRAAKSGPPAPATAPQTGMLQITGTAVEKLILVSRKDFKKRILDHPGTSVPLPAGEYMVEQIAVPGGFQRRLAVSDRFTIAPGKVHQLDVGTPPIARITAKRRGSVLKLGYVLENTNGWLIRPDRSNPPRFIVYQGEREIGSGKFEYG